MLQYHGGKIFGKSENDTNLLAKTMLGLMINSLHGGPKFFLKMIPVAKLNEELLHSEKFIKPSIILNQHLVKCKLYFRRQ